VVLGEGGNALFLQRRLGGVGKVVGGGVRKAVGGGVGKAVGGGVDRGNGGRGFGGDAV
jgi:hypothetical protein